MSTVLVTGGSGYVGRLLQSHLQAEGKQVVIVDQRADPTQGEQLCAYRTDICDVDRLRAIFQRHRPQTVYHAAAMLPHGKSHPTFLWRTNVEGTRRVAEAAREFGAERMIYLSTSAVWGRGIRKPVKESDVPAPTSAYGSSKLAAEEIVLEFQRHFYAQVLRFPALLTEESPGLLPVLFQAIRDGRTAWTVGDGRNHCQLLAGSDLLDACQRLHKMKKSGILHLGSDQVLPLRATYERVIQRAGSSASVVAIPKGVAPLISRLTRPLRLPDSEPYFGNMMAEDFQFDTTLAKKELGWQPALTNEEMLWQAYERFVASGQNLPVQSAAAGPAVMSPFAWLAGLETSR